MVVVFCLFFKRYFSFNIYFFFAYTIHTVVKNSTRPVSYSKVLYTYVFILYATKIFKSIIFYEVNEKNKNTFFPINLLFARLLIRHKSIIVEPFCLRICAC